MVLTWVQGSLSTDAAEGCGIYLLTILALGSHFLLLFHFIFPYVHVLRFSRHGVYPKLSYITHSLYRLNRTEQLQQTVAGWGTVWVCYSSAPAEVTDTAMEVPALPIGDFLANLLTPLRPLATTVRCGRRPQHLRSHRDAIRGHRPP